MGATLRGRDATRPVPNGSLRLLRIGDISQHGDLVSENILRFEPNSPINPELILRSGDVLFPNRGTRTTAFTYRLEGGPTAVGAQFFLLRPKNKQVFPEYLAWYLRTEQSAQYFERLRKGSYVQIIERKDLAEMEIPIPPLQTQKQIVELAALALRERDLVKRIADLKWKLQTGQLLAAGQETQAR